MVVVCYNMRRELPRTIYSLSPGVQQDIDRSDYEVIVVDNGSTDPFDRDACEATGVRLVFAEHDSPGISPVGAVNQGLAMARGDLCGVMIDGARIASPGLLAGALRAATLHARPVVASLGFHLGPDVQMRSVREGYDQATEDRLLEEVRWTEDPYRLFRISVFSGSSKDGWFAPIKESNALFLTRALWDELGGYDPRFASPGGGFVNLDTYKRACELPGTQLFILLGEGTFHQVHGGVATNSADPPAKEFSAEYRRIRGSWFETPNQSPIYVGRVHREILPSIRESAMWKAGSLHGPAGGSGAGDRAGLDSTQA